MKNYPQTNKESMKKPKKKGTKQIKRRILTLISLITQMMTKGTKAQSREGEERGNVSSLERQTLGLTLGAERTKVR